MNSRFKHMLKHEKLGHFPSHQLWRTVPNLRPPRNAKHTSGNRRHREEAIADRAPKRPCFLPNTALHQRRRNSNNNIGQCVRCAPIQTRTTLNALSRSIHIDSMAEHNLLCNRSVWWARRWDTRGAKGDWVNWDVCRTEFITALFSH